MAWHVAGSLQTLLRQLNAVAPNRSKVSDGSIGDSAHASRTSDHNPWYRETVTARDFTHDPGNGADMHKFTDALVRHRDPRVKYIIWNRRIWGPSYGWKAYTGPNPHTKHAHVSVVASPACEQTHEFNLSGFAGGGQVSNPAPPAAPPVGLYHRAPLGLPTIRRGVDNGGWDFLAQDVLRELGFYKGRTDGDIGPASERAIRALQARAQIAQDGVLGMDSWMAAIRLKGVLKQGAHKGSNLNEVWQNVLGLRGKEADSDFGPTTALRTREVQAWLGVGADAEVGNLTTRAVAARL